MIKIMKISVASAVTAALLWVGCSALVVIFPDAMWRMTAHMFHLDLAQTRWAMSWSGFIVGLVSWTLIAALTGALLSMTYNSLLRSDTRST